jgi:hypothetical protein
VRRENGQASVELVACAALLALVAVAAVQWLAVVRTRIAAERIADQAAVLAAEGRPIPAGLRQGARIERHGARLVVSVRLPFALPGFPAEQAASAVMPP